MPLGGILRAMSRIFKTRHFQRWVRKTGLTDAALRRAVAEMADGMLLEIES